MKQLLFSFLCFLALSGFSQVTVKINPKTLQLCFGSPASFTATRTPDTVNCFYTWKHNGVILPGFDTIGKLTFNEVSFADTGYYSCVVFSPVDTVESDTGYLHITPKLNIDTLYRYNQLGCPETCIGQMKALISGGLPPYTYEWGGGHQQDPGNIVIGLCKGDYLLKVTDSTNSHCVSRKYRIDVLSIPKIQFTMTDPETQLEVDTVYLTKPYLLVEFPDSAKQYITNWIWSIELVKDSVQKVTDSTTISNINPYQHQFTRIGKYKISLNYTDLNGCDTTIVDFIYVKQADMFIPNVFTPNCDSFNDCFIFYEKTDKTRDVKEIYLKIELVVVNRWGKKVYDNSNYYCRDKQSPCACDGWKADGLADGVYFYVLTCHGVYGDDVFRGSVTILR
jgi:hypothetical protein